MRRLLYYVRVFLLVVIGLCLLGITLWFFSQRILTSNSELSCYRCNVIFISIDDLGAKHSSVYDGTLATTPFLSELADTRAIVFNHAYSNAPWTLPSHTAMFTGTYPWLVGMNTLTDKLSPDVPTIFTAIASHGYDTVSFSDGPFVHPIWGTTNGITSFTGSIQYKDWNDVPKLFTDASTWLSDRKSNKPFLLLLHPFGVHDPYGTSNTANPITPHDIVTVNTQAGGPTSEQVARYKNAYQKNITETDSALRSFFTAFDASPYAKNTIVIVVSDHGEEFNEHGSLGTHGISVYNEVLHVPLLIILPKGTARRLNQTVELKSLPATIMELVGYGSEHTFPSSSSLVPMLTGKNVPNQQIVSGTDNSKELFLKVYEKGPEHSTEENTSATVSLLKNAPHQPLFMSVLQGNLHLIKKDAAHFELYDIARDPDEQKDIFSERTGLTPEERERLTNMILQVTSHP